MIAVLLATLWTNTAHVERIAAAGATLWVATAGGVEEYALPAGTRTALYTTDQGLDSNAVHRVWVEDGVVRVRTERSVCLLRQGRFACSAAEGPLQPVVAVAGRFNGARETARLKVGEQTVVATAGAGLWLDGRRITPSMSRPSRSSRAASGWADSTPACASWRTPASAPFRRRSA